ncbi:MAG: AI-2E family transporter, partial [Myxococcota bacterium]
MTDRPANSPSRPHAPPDDEPASEPKRPRNPLKLGDDAGTARVIAMVRWLLYAAFVVIGYLVLRRLAPILTPVLAAGGIAYLLDPLVDRLEDQGTKRVIAVALLLCAFISMLVMAVVIVVPLVRDDIELFITRLPDMIPRAAEWIELNLDIAVPDAWRRFSGDEATALLEAHAG